MNISLYAIPKRSSFFGLTALKSSMDNKIQNPEILQTVKF